jgi:hypothetical protein
MVTSVANEYRQLYRIYSKTSQLREEYGKLAEVPLMPELDFAYGNRGYPRERNSSGSGAAIQA